MYAQGRGLSVVQRPHWRGKRGERSEKTSKFNALENNFGAREGRDIGSLDLGQADAQDG
jgi:hypothetical protein